MTTPPMPRAYEDLCRLAESCLGKHGAKTPLQAHEVVHEAYIRLAGDSSAPQLGLEHFTAQAPQAIRALLADLARSTRSRSKPVVRDHPSLQRQTLGSGGGIRDLALLDLEEALLRLAALDEMKARIVRLRFFDGLTIQETANATGVSHATVERLWRDARNWLCGQLEAPS